MNKLHLLNSFMIVCSLENKYMFYPKEENEEVVGLEISYLNANWHIEVSCKLTH